VQRPLIKYEQSSAEDCLSCAKDLDFQSSTTVVLLENPGRDTEKTKANKMYNIRAYHVKAKMAFGLF
jgi:hypothetical protein